MSSLEYLEALSSGGAEARYIQLMVQHTQERTGWVALPPALCSRLFEALGAELPLALELRPVLRRVGVSLPSDIPCYVAWAGATCAAGCVGVPAGLARALGLAEGMAVAARVVPGVPAAVSVTVEPASEDDWEVVQLNVEYLEDQLLNQVGVASLHQLLPCWIRSLGVMLRVTAMVPEAPVVRLVRGSEIYVAPCLRVQPAQATEAAGDVLRPGGGIEARTSRPLHAGRGTADQQQGGGSPGQEEDGEVASSAAPLQTVLRVQQVSDRLAYALLASSGTAAKGAVGPPQQQHLLPPQVQVMYACPATLARCGLQPGDWVRLQGRDCRSLVKFASLAASELAAPGHLALTAQQCKWAGAPPCSHLRLQRLTRDQRKLVWEAAGGSKLGSMTSAGSNGTAMAVSQQQQQQQQQEDDLTTSSQAALAISGWLRAAAEAALCRLLPVLGFTPRSLLQGWCAPRPGGLLVCGPAGSGKTALLAAAAAVLRVHSECLTYTVTLSCREMSAEGASQAQAQILPKVQEALDHLPALLVLDDLDVLCPAESSGADGAAKSADPALVAWLCDLLDHLATPSPYWGRLPLSAMVAGSNGSSRAVQASLGTALWPPLAVAASCRNAAMLAAPLRAAGRLDHIVSLPVPSADSRAAILVAAAAARGTALEACQLQQVAEQADGFDAADLEVLLDRALHIALRRQLVVGPTSGEGGADASSSKQQADSQVTAVQAPASAQPQRDMQLRESDLLAALQGFTPAAYWGTGSRKAVQAGVVGWQDVGGMEEARQALHEALELPTKYARLVAQAPLRLRTGVLLYGPPGCGKTHIVAAAVAATGVRCITVSGPELLNKYIGASEAAVRDVFQRAATAAPCLLFFDEFDAIAPQRGHDNTGVTDRVVNQLLTELDGVEGLRGVCVVGATSRPDLLDAALLRPGRLDRLVFCGFPSPLERGAVLRALSRGVQLAPDVDLALAGYNAEFFSCADLAALLADAQLMAVHEALEGAEAKASPHAATPTTSVIIQRRHLEVALATVRPSVPEGERDRLEAVYSRFRQDRELDGSSGVADKGKGKLVSWA